MSVEGFVQNLQGRRRELTVRIEEIIRENGGKPSLSRTKRLREERDAIDTAIYRATRKGIVE